MAVSWELGPASRAEQARELRQYLLARGGEAHVLDVEDDLGPLMEPLPRGVRREGDRLVLED